MTNVIVLPKTRRSSMNISRRFIQIAILFFVIVRVSLHFRSKSIPTVITTSSSSTQKEVKHSNNTPLSETANDTAITSTAPLFYHISPGSSGSRTLYHATCKLGFPSVHHISFCISNSRGIHGVNNTVVKGIHSCVLIIRCE